MVQSDAPRASTTTGGLEIPGIVEHSHRLLKYWLGAPGVGTPPAACAKRSGAAATFGPGRNGLGGTLRPFCAVPNNIAPISAKLK